MTRDRENVGDLVNLARAGDTAAFEALYREHQAGIYTFIRSQVREPELAADLTQETFVRAWESLRGLRKVGAFRGWLHRIAGNLVRDEVKSGRARLEVAASELLGDEDRGLRLDPPDRGEKPEEAALSAELRQQLWSALQELPAEQRGAVVMHHLEGMGMDEIAHATGVRPGTVMSRLARAREALRRRLSEYVEASDEQV
jgi:RNA polymerase sigma-70 factor (ECF subfamily)